MSIWIWLLAIVIGVALWSRSVNLAAAIIDFVLKMLLQNTIVYSVAVEDPRQDKELLQLDSTDVLIMITTGGCNVLDRIIDGPRKVITVDYNRNQNALMELRLACVKHLTYEDMWAIWGCMDGVLLERHYRETLRDELSSAAKQFWDRHLDIVSDLHYSGGSGAVVKLALRVARLFGLGEFMRRVSQAETLEAQRGEYERVRKQMLAFLNFLWGTFYLLSPFLGVPSRQLAIVSDRNFLIEVFDHTFRHTHLRTENYIYLAYLTGAYSEASRPRYLTPAGFAALKDNYVSGRTEVVIRTALLADVIAEQADGSLTAAILLDSMDWMPDSVVEAQIDLLRRKMSPARGRLLWRSAGELLTHGCLASLSYDRAAVSAVQQRLPCLMGSYKGTFLARFDAERATTWSRIADSAFPDNGIVTDLTVINAMFFKPISSGERGEQEERLNSFYLTQADKYDGYRQYMLHGRTAMVKAIPLSAAAPLTWVDFGCGTGSNFELIKSKYIARAVGLDLCQPLLDIAQQRIRRLGIADKVELRQADVCKPTGLPDGFADVATFSYSLTMIPDWQAALQEAVRVLRPGGILAIADFTPSARRSAVNNAFWKAIFETSHVLLDSEHRKLLHKLVQPVFEWEDQGGFPYVPYLRCPYYSFTGIKRTAEEEAAAAGKPAAEAGSGLAAGESLAAAE